MKRRLLLIGSAVGLFTTIAIGPMPAAATPCTNLNHLPLKHTTITSAEDNTTGTFTDPNSQKTFTGLPHFCRVTATLTPMSDSSIKIEVWLPETWNGMFLGTGGGGFQGVITYGELSGGIGLGFATANSDLGTGSSGCNPNYCGSAGNMGNPVAIAAGDPATPSTGLFGHPERIKDFGYRATHLMTVRSKEIVQHFYPKKAQTAYFFGCSTGGQNALMEAQRFPDDYNGIIAGAAAFNRTHLAFQELLPEPFYDGLFYWVFGPSFGYPSSAVNYTNFHFHNDIDKVDDLLAEPLNAVSTDLSDFRRRGGKLIMYHGWADPLIPSQSSINYFNALVRHDSQDDDGFQQARFEPDGNNNLRKTQEYARLFMVPGMYHCSGGPGPNLNVVDALTSLVNWVEQGVAPETIIAKKDTPPMTRPLCVFPKVAKYQGGDTNDAKNFICIADEPDFNQTPAPKYGP